MASSKPASSAISAPVVEAEAVTRHYGRGTATVVALRGIDLRVAPGERVAIMGPSGCGKSTLLGMLAGLDQPTSGRVTLDGSELAKCSRSERARLRRTCVGYVPQSAHLLPMLTVEENVEVPLALQNQARDARRSRVRELLERVGIADKATALPEELSGGQQQRVAIARALAGQPLVLLADEPAGSLDSLTAATVLKLLAEEAERSGAALLMVTHQRDEAEHADRIIRMRDGQIVVDETTA